MPEIIIQNNCPTLKYNFRWEVGVEVPGNETKATIPNLIEKEEYEFRVTAVNKGGLSDPSDPSEKVIAKARNRKY